MSSWKTRKLTTSDRQKMANIAHPKMPAIMFHTKKHAQKKQNQKQKIKKYYETQINK